VLDVSGSPLVREMVGHVQPQQLKVGQVAQPSCDV
jgi:hypothetical protein